MVTDGLTELVSDETVTRDAYASKITVSYVTPSMNLRNGNFKAYPLISENPGPFSC